MREHAPITLSLKLDKTNFATFFPLLQQGFLVQAQIGESIKNVLCEQFKVKSKYVEERLTTIFLDGQPVDDVDSALVKDSCTVALSAAMPGLVGATLRRGGVLAAFRNRITYQGGNPTVDAGEAGMVKIKLFNLVVRELGPTFLKAGIWVKKEDVDGFLKAQADTLPSLLVSAQRDGREISHEQLAALNWSEEPEHVLLRVLT